MLQWLRPPRRVSRVYKLFEAHLNQLMASAPPAEEPNYKLWELKPNQGVDIENWCKLI